MRARNYSRRKADSSRSPFSLRERLREYELEIIVDALIESGGNQSDAAELLGVSLRALVYKLSRFRQAATMPADGPPDTQG